LGKYVSIQEVKQFSRISYSDLGFSSETEYESWLETIIDYVERTIENYCRIPAGFFQDGGLSFTEIQDWKEDGEIHTRYYPIIAITKVELDMAGYNQTANWTEIPSTYYYAKNEYGIIKIVGKTPGHVEDSVRITYTAGYSAVPDDIKIATLTYTSNILHNIQVRSVGKNVDIGDLRVQNVVLEETFTAEIKSLLKPYKRVFAIHE